MAHSSSTVSGAVSQSEIRLSVECSLSMIADDEKESGLSMPRRKIKAHTFALRRRPLNVDVAGRMGGHFGQAIFLAAEWRLCCLAFPRPAARHSAGSSGRIASCRCTSIPSHPSSSLGLSCTFAPGPGEWYGRCGATVAGCLTPICTRRDDTDLPVAHQPRHECGILCS